MSGSQMPGPEYEFKAFRYSSHYWILKLLETEKRPLKILDVGTAGGYLGKTLTGRGHRVTGIERDPVYAQKARGYYEFFDLADIETFEFSYRQEFDYILFADVLEHLRDPAAVLRRSIPALRKSGQIVISVPNVANCVIRLSLLLGRFDYMDRGILDRTHFRFFTLRSLKQMMNEVSCKVRKVVPTPLPVQILFPFTDGRFVAPIHEVLYALTRCWKTMFAYQFVVIAAPAPAEVVSEPGDKVPGERMLADK